MTSFGSAAQARPGRAGHAAHRHRPTPVIWRSSSDPAGVEAYVEPRTTVTDTTILLVAHDGEWTRRRVDGPRGAERSPSGRRSRSTTRPWSATRSGCATTTPGRSATGCQPLVSRPSSASVATMVRTMKPVPPLCCSRAALEERRPGDVQVHPLHAVGDEVPQERAADQHRRPPVLGQVDDVGDRGVQPRAQVVGQRHRPQRLAGRGAERRPPGRGRPRCPSRRRCCSPSATTWPPVRVAVSIR